MLATLVFGASGNVGLGSASVSAGMPGTVITPVEPLSSTVHDAKLKRPAAIIRLNNCFFINTIFFPVPIIIFLILKSLGL